MGKKKWVWKNPKPYLVFAAILYVVVAITLGCIPATTVIGIVLCFVPIGIFVGILLVGGAFVLWDNRPRRVPR